VVEHVDAIGTSDRRQPIGDEHDGPTSHQRLEVAEEVDPMVG